MDNFKQEIMFSGFVTKITEIGENIKICLRSGAFNNPEYYERLENIKNDIAAIVDDARSPHPITYRDGDRDTQIISLRREASRLNKLAISMKENTLPLLTEDDIKKSLNNLLSGIEKSFDAARPNSFSTAAEEEEEARELEEEMAREIEEEKHHIRQERFHV